MPARFFKPCSAPGCSTLTDSKTGRCEEHPRAAWVRNDPPPERMRGRKLMAARKALFAREPLCRPCYHADPQLLTVAVMRDHVVPLEEGGEDTDENTQPICKACHDVKSEAERLRGIKRWSGAQAEPVKTAIPAPIAGAQPEPAPKRYRLA